jgi:hypothetical protein
MHGVVAIVAGVLLDIFDAYYFYPLAIKPVAGAHRAEA